MITKLVVYVCMYTCVDIYVYMYIHIYRYISLSLSLSTYIYIYIHTYKAALFATARGEDIRVARPCPWRDAVRGARCREFRPRGSTTGFHIHLNLSSMTNIAIMIILIIIAFKSIQLINITKITFSSTPGLP